MAASEITPLAAGNKPESSTTTTVKPIGHPLKKFCPKCNRCIDCGDCEFWYVLTLTFAISPPPCPIFSPVSTPASHRFYVISPFLFFGW